MSISYQYSRLCKFFIVPVGWVVDARTRTGRPAVTATVSRRRCSGGAVGTTEGRRTGTVSADGRTVSVQSGKNNIY